MTNEGLVFDFLASQPGAHVMTGHDEGLITIDIAEADPAERELSRRSGGPAISLWLVIGAIVLLGLLVYAVSALF